MGRIKFICLFGGMLSIVCIFTVKHGFSSGSADIRGTVTRLSRAGGEGQKRIIGKVLIEGRKETDTHVDKAYVSVTSETRFFISHYKERKSASFNDLKEGQLVEANFTGPVMESYPVQATASEI